jgi:hypothetical protein
LVASDQINTDDYRYNIKSRLQKKLQQFTNEKLPLLVAMGYLADFCKVSNGERRRHLD